MKKILFFICLFFGFNSYSQNCDSPAEKAIELLGEESNICGLVSQVYYAKNVNGSPTYINLGGDYPNHSFTIVIWGDEREKFTYPLEDLEGKEVSVFGIVKEYKGKAQVIVEKEEDISVLSK